ncbi:MULTISPECIES: diaminopimelate decarboxylase [Thermoactinomyces]|uniref:Diaminopimelate decarboxylase n=1 Tax=Thermoactinomyces daqus TaxID=1329516 RepID=A0A7W1XAM1_9BACL|nr:MULTISPECIES: diaminopimelate decarboxylase [Thermoactinomyces]MBA4543086.1 diaminopimelate decarboxylase [Thermoactinomyces daqus]MBH8603441.1 diaminopimelate decarboxylase [Thermoactinomyces sp. CICC 10522]MBH8606606.1 diaminopimelate decarboxylase [Thermoactinomyces sp. CICC 10521]
MYLHGTSRINEAGHLEIGGCDAVELAKRFGTPLYVMDEAWIRSRMRNFVKAAKETMIPFRVAYASKAFNTLAMCRLVDEEGLLLDVVSGGELFTALRAGMPAERIYFHGNNKSPAEIELALDAGIRLFVADNFTELEMLEAIAAHKGKVARVILRVSPGVEAHTHAYIQTGQADSKFGFDLESGQALQGVRMAEEAGHLCLEGFHCHIGSQIFETEAFELAAEKMAGLCKDSYGQFGFETKVLNMGGGFGIRYDENDHPQPVERYVNIIADAMKKQFAGLPFLPEIWIEPGRAIVGTAGTTLYTLGTVKEVPGVRKYVAVDGGMTDNPRPALYQAKYEAFLANRALEEAEEVVSIAGKCCESGDMLIWDLPLPAVRQGDLLAVPCTGAYNYSMSSNYNRFPRPAVVFVQNGQAELVVKRETYEDLISHDVIPKRLLKNAPAAELEMIRS